MRKFGFLVLATLLISASDPQQSDELYANYKAALENESTFQFFLVVNTKNLNNLETREYCTKGNFLKGALHRELNLGYSQPECSIVDSIAITNQQRFFEFKNDSAIWNIGGVHYYSMNELTELETKVNFDSLATRINLDQNWNMRFEEDKMMKLYAHALFNRGVLTGENNSFGGTLEFVNLRK